MNKIQLNLSVDQVNVILNALGELPFKSVYELINEIQAQANEQLEEVKSNMLQNNEQHQVQSIEK